MILGRRVGVPSLIGTPKRRQKTPKTAVSLATRKSAQRATPRPPATAWPSTAAMTGFVEGLANGPFAPAQGR